MFDKILSFVFGAYTASEIDVVNDQPVPNYEYPGDSCCTFWDDQGFSGDSLTLCMTDSSSTDWEIFDLHDYDFNDKQASWWCGKSVAYDMCNNFEDDDCNNDHGNMGAGNIRTSDCGHDDDLTTLKMKFYDPEVLGAVTIFTSVDCTGPNGRLWASEDPYERLNYSKSDLEYNNIKNDEAESILVPFGLAVELFTEDGAIGEPQERYEGPVFSDDS